MLIISMFLQSASEVSSGEGIQPLNEKMKNLDLGQDSAANEAGAAGSLVHLEKGAEAKTVNKTETGLSRFLHGPSTYSIVFVFVYLFV